MVVVVSSEAVAFDSAQVIGECGGTVATIIVADAPEHEFRCTRLVERLRVQLTEVVLLEFF